MSRVFRGARHGAVALALLLLAATSALGQGFYYKEILKDGRIYVFNVAANAERFESTGEMKAAITKAGAGPNGETVEADSPRALQLYYFKHGIAEAVPEPPPAPLPYRFSGLMFGDYYAFAQHHLPEWEGQHGVWLRRVYFTYDHTFTPRLSTRLRLEMNSNGKLAGGTLTPYVKDAYLRWGFYGRQALMIGIQPSLTFEFIDAVWGLRHIEKTPLDLYRVDASRETGITVAGPLNASQTLKYAAQFGNDSGHSAEPDKFKGFRFSARHEPKHGLTAEAMFGHAHRANDADRTTAQLFAAYRAANGRAGAQYSFQRRRAPSTSTAADVDLRILSGFGVLDLKPQKFSVFLRADRYADPCPDCAGIDYLPIATSHPFTMTLAGVEYFVHPAVRISPNIEWIAYGGEAAAKPVDNAIARLTFYWTF